MPHPKLHGKSLDNDVRRNECSYSIQKEDCKNTVWSQKVKKKGEDKNKYGDT